MCGPCRCKAKYVKFSFLSFLFVILTTISLIYFWPTPHPKIFEAIRYNEVDQVRARVSTLLHQGVTHRIRMQQRRFGASNNNHIDNTDDDDHDDTPFIPWHVDQILLSSGRRCMHVAATYSAIESMQVLHDLGANLNVRKTNDGRTPLHLAAAYGTPPTVAWLLNNGADANAVCHNDFTPLMMAIMFSNKDNAELLLKYGADVHAENGNGHSVMQLALGYSDDDTLTVLFEAGGEVFPEEGNYEQFLAFQRYHERHVQPEKDAIKSAKKREIDHRFDQDDNLEEDDEMYVFDIEENVHIEL